VANGGASRTALRIERQQFEIEGVRFISSYSLPSTDEELSICKSPSQVDRYRELLGSLACSNIVELGISKGGSVAMLSLLADPSCLISV
jgi:cephalosporin hydroxylase